MMNSAELAYQMRRLSMDSVSSSGSSSSVPPPPEMLSAAMSLDSTHEFELDCSQFDAMTAMTPAPSFGSLTSHQSRGNGLSRSRCVHNLSSLGSASSSDYSVGSLRQESSYPSGPNSGPGWGYYVDTPSR